MRRAVTIGALVAAAALATAGCGARSADSAPQTDTAPTVTVVHSRRANATHTVTLPGDLVAWADSTLYAKVTGYLRRIDVDKGDWVRRGQVLAEIEVPEIEQQLKRARARLDVRRVTYERVAGVWKTDRRLVARQDVDIAEGQFEEAQADVEELETLVGYTKITAPFDGVVTARYVDPGALIQASSRATGETGAAAGKSAAVPVLRVADIGTMRVYVYVPEAETSLARRGMPATLALREYPDRTFTGSVARFATALDLSTRTMLTEVDLDNAHHELYPGMYADVTLELARHENAIEVPAGALDTDGHATSVWVVRDGVLAKVPVTTGLRGDAWVEVTSGLAGDEALVAGAKAGLSDGERVHTVMANEQSARTEGSG